MGMTFVLWAFVGLFFIGFIFYFISIYNGLVLLKNNIKKSWGNIDVLLMQRSDELPKLVNAVKGYMAHESQTLERLTEARTRFLNAQTVVTKAEAHSAISSALKDVFAVSENYPNLKANENFLKVQSRISGLENEIVDRREFYNDSVNNYNIRIQSIPDVIIACMLSYQQEEIFNASNEDRIDVEIKL